MPDVFTVPFTVNPPPTATPLTVDKVPDVTLPDTVIAVKPPKEVIPKLPLMEPVTVKLPPKIALDVVDIAAALSNPVVVIPAALILPLVLIPAALTVPVEIGRAHV